MSLLVFYLAHVYAVLVGRWSEEAIAPTWTEARAELRRQWPMVSVGALPVIVLLLAAFDVVDDRTAISVAFGLCIFGLAATSWYAAREAGASRMQSVLAVGGAVAIGMVIIALKALLK
ncbi:MAG: hypothetical protein KGR19_04705 [Acidobacteria bacterium]|nr:hypothetical protein [Acidobacteriota bacterium]